MIASSVFQCSHSESIGAKEVIPYLLGIKVQGIIIVQEVCPFEGEKNSTLEVIFTVIHS